MRKFHIMMLAFCVLAAGLLYHDFLSHARDIWTTLMHDRNGHYGYGLDMALALEKGSVGQFFAQLEKGKVWPPLHGLLVAVTQIFSGNDWRAAVLPSLTGWLLMLWCVWYTAQKIAAPTGLGWEAGMIGFIFAVLSPGGRLYATDIMLESLGGGLTMLVLACYARAAEERDSARAWRALGLAMTALFFEKYNYWMIATAALVLAESGTWIAIMRGWLRETDMGKFCRAQLCEPLNWLCLILTGAFFWLFARGPTAFLVFGHRLSLYPPHNVMTAAYVVLFLRVALAIKRSGWKPRNAQEQMLFRWHVLPLSISFLLPQRLSVFIGFLSPTNNDVGTRDFKTTLSYYSHAFAADYHPSTAFAILALVLALVAVARFKTLGPAARAVILCMLIGAALNILHPNQKSRFLHSWIPAVWTASGLGAAILLQRVPRRSLVAGAGIAVLAFAGGRAMVAQAEATQSPRSMLDMSDEWLRDTVGAQHVAFFSTQPSRPFMEWTFLASHHARDQFEWPAWQDKKSDAELSAGFEQWIAQTKADAIVFLDVSPESVEFRNILDQTPLRESMNTLLGKQTRFKLTKRIGYPDYKCMVSIWRAN
ncbi:MAG: hypothetical protein WCD79_19225 [Chthoniobacteraceae bacterium]